MLLTGVFQEKREFTEQIKINQESLLTGQQ